MPIVVEALHEALAHVLVDERVVGDVVLPHLVLLGGREVAVEEEVRHLEVGRLLRELLDRVAPVAQDAGLAVELGDGARGGGGGGERRIVEPDAGEELRPLGRVDAAVRDRDLDGLPGPVVGDGHTLCH
jgi:hypothetical protein